MTLKIMQDEIDKLNYQLLKLKQDHAAEIDKLKQNHSEELRQIQNAHNNEIRQLWNRYEGKNDKNNINAYIEIINKQQAQIEEVKEELQKAKNTNESLRKLNINLSKQILDFRSNLSIIEQTLDEQDEQNNITPTTTARPRTNKSSHSANASCSDFVNNNDNTSLEVNDSTNDSTNDNNNDKTNNVNSM